MNRKSSSDIIKISFICTVHKHRCAFEKYLTQASPVPSCVIPDNRQIFSSLLFTFKFTSKTIHKKGTTTLLNQLYESVRDARTIISREHPLLNKVNSGKTLCWSKHFSNKFLVLLSSAITVPSISFSSAGRLISCVCCVQNVTCSGVCFVRDHASGRVHARAPVRDGPSGDWCRGRACVSRSRGHGLFREKRCEFGSVISSFCCYAD